MGQTAAGHQVPLTSGYPARLRFALELHDVVDAARALGLPFEMGPEGITVIVATPQEAYDLGTEHAALRMKRKRT